MPYMHRWHWPGPDDHSGVNPAGCTAVTTTTSVGELHIVFFFCFFCQATGTHISYCTRRAVKHMHTRTGCKIILSGLSRTAIGFRSVRGRLGLPSQTIRRYYYVLLLHVITIIIGAGARIPTYTGK